MRTGTTPALSSEPGSGSPQPLSLLSGAGLVLFSASGGKAYALFLPVKCHTHLGCSLNSHNNNNNNDNNNNNNGGAAPDKALPVPPPLHCSKLLSGSASPLVTIEWHIPGAGGPSPWGQHPAAVTCSSGASCCPELCTAPGAGPWHPQPLAEPLAEPLAKQSHSVPRLPPLPLALQCQPGAG